jgi:hypothetical protein
LQVSRGPPVALVGDAEIRLCGLIDVMQQISLMAVHAQLPARMQGVSAPMPLQHSSHLLQHLDCLLLLPVLSDTGGPAPPHTTAWRHMAASVSRSSAAGSLGSQQLQGMGDAAGRLLVITGRSSMQHVCWNRRDDHACSGCVLCLLASYINCLFWWQRHVPACLFDPLTSIILKRVPCCPCFC